MDAPTPVSLMQLLAFAAAVVAGAVALTVNLVRNRQFGDAAVRSRTATAGILFQGLAFFVAGFGRVDASRSWNSPAALLGTAAVLLIGFGAVVLFVAAVRAMGRNWSVVARTRSDHQLVRNGPFGVVRHPIYLALFLYFLSFGIAVGHWRQMLLAIPVYVLGTVIRIRSEEKVLRAQFGEAHARYTREVPAFIPLMR